MKKIILFLFFIFFVKVKSDIDLKICSLPVFKTIQNCDVDWAIIGAGPAGIVTIGVLLELGVLPNRIIWIDPEFNVGRLSTYSTVPANGKNKVFVKFLESCDTFKKCAAQEIEELKKLNFEKEYPLETIVKPLQSITNCLCNIVNFEKGNIQSLYYDNDKWNIGINNKILTSYNVVLATGSHPKTLNYEEHKYKEIPLDVALDKSQLEQIVKPTDVVAVVGGAHSAILVLKYLTEMNVKKILNFYKNPITYAIEMENLTLNGEHGLKGIAAEWAKNVLEKNPPANLERIISNNETLTKYLAECTKIIYAIGYERNELPYIKENPNLNYDPTTGIVAQRLFGIGIAFPDKGPDPLGNVEYHIGLNSFLEYAQKVIPCWMQNRNLNFDKSRKKLFEQFEELFEIRVL